MKVLVIDDMPFNLTVLSALLKRAGYAVETASTHNEAIRLFTGSRPDAVLSDLHLNGEENGFALARSLRQLPGAEGVRIALMTADIGVRPDECVDAVLEKPISLEAIKYFLEGKREMKNSIRAWLTEQFGADEELFADLYGQYAADMKKFAAELEPLLASGDAAAIGEKGHAMKGMALQIGDSELSEPCLKLQNAGRLGNLADCAPLVREISALVASL